MKNSKRTVSKNRKAGNSNIKRDQGGIVSARNGVIQPAPATRRGRPPVSEPKYLDTTQVSLSVPLSGTIVPLTAISNGTTDITRIGDRVSLHSCEIRWTGVVSDQWNVIRLILFQWLPDSSNDPPSAGAVLADTSVSPVNSPFNHDSALKMVVVYDRRIQVFEYRPIDGDTSLIMLNTGRIQTTVGFTAGNSSPLRGIFALFV